MNNDTLKRMLNAVYELEALVDLALRRNPIPEQFEELISAKASEIVALTQAPDPRQEENDNNDCPDLQNIEQQARPLPDLRRLFSINDKFLFRRELFTGSQADFDDTLHRISGFSSLSQLQELIAEKGWNEELPETARFLDIIRKAINI